MHDFVCVFIFKVDILFVYERVGMSDLHVWVHSHFVTALDEYDICHFNTKLDQLHGFLVSVAVLCCYSRWCFLGLQMHAAVLQGFALLLMPPMLTELLY